MQFFTEEHLKAGILTDEHVPPRSVGGKPLVLTCQACNNLASGGLDESVADDEKLRTFGKPNSVGRLPGSVTVGGFRNNGSIGFDGKTFVLLGHPGQNNPETVAAHSQPLDAMGAGSSMTVKFRVRRDLRQASLGWMRAAYLVGFAVYGYRYVLQAAFNIVREAVAVPDLAAFEPTLLRGPNDGALDPSIAEVTGPDWLTGSVAVSFGPRVILLPPWGAPADWLEALGDRIVASFPVSLTCRSAIGRPFPEHPMHLCDG